MTKQEFENLALRDGEKISWSLYENSIERFYMSDNNYHRSHGGVDESKQAFVKRVYGGKVNTAKTVALKTIAEAIRENRYCLLGTSVTKADLDRMDRQIAEQIAWEAADEKYGSPEYNALMRAWEKTKHNPV